MRTLHQLPLGCDAAYSGHAVADKLWDDVSARDTARLEGDLPEAVSLSSHHKQATDGGVVYDTVPVADLEF